MSRFIRTRPTTSPCPTRRRLLGAGLGAVPLGGALLGALSPLPTHSQTSSAAIAVTDLGGLVLLQSPDCNVLALAGDNGALMIDGCSAIDADAVLGAVNDSTGNDRVARLINTHWHPQVTGANESVGRSGGTILAHENTAMYLRNTIHQSVAFEGRRDALPEFAWPAETTRGEGTLEFAGVRVDYGHLPQAHTDGDLYVHFSDLNVLAAGGVVSADSWPLLDYFNGAWYGGRVRALQALAGIVDADTRVVPDAGPLLSGRDIVRLRDIYLDLFETMIAYMNMGFGAEDAVAANPLAEYEDEFGDPSSFLDGAFRSMQIAYVPD